MKNILALLSTVVLLSSCAGDGVTINGNIAKGGIEKTIIVERVLPVGSRFVDSVKSNNKGDFEIFIEQESKTSEFYTLRIVDGGSVSLLTATLEQIIVNIADSTGREYTVAGSEGSLLVQQANTILAIPEPINRKQRAAVFLAQNRGSLAAIVPLYQKAVDGSFIFVDDQSDVVYFSMVSDSLSRRYPESPYAEALADDVQKFNNIAEAQKLVADNMDNVVTFPEIDMPDVLGKRQKLSDHKGDVILLSFTASNIPELKIMNRELVEVYNKHSAEGFAVYQVSLDQNKAQWIGSVAEQRLPWTSVCDLKGAESIAVRTYNVQKIPANFLINREGDIVRRDVPASEIEAAVIEIL